MQSEPSMYSIAWFQNQSFLKWKHRYVSDHPGLISLCENVIVYMHACILCARLNWTLQLKEEASACIRLDPCVSLYMCMCPCACTWCVCLCVLVCGSYSIPILLFMGGSEMWWKVWREMDQWWHSLMFTPSGYGPHYIRSIHHKAALKSHMLPIPFVTMSIVHVLVSSMLWYMSRSYL